MEPPYKESQYLSDNVSASNTPEHTTSALYA